MQGKGAWLRAQRFQDMCFVPSWNHEKEDSMIRSFMKWVCSTHWDQGRPGFGVSTFILPTAQCGGASHEISASKTPGCGWQLLVLWPKPVVEMKLWNCSCETKQVWHNKLLLLLDTVDFFLGYFFHLLFWMDASICWICYIALPQP